jgi:hypothetical protein
MRFGWLDGVYLGFGFLFSFLCLGCWWGWSMFMFLVAGVGLYISGLMWGIHGGFGFLFFFFFTSVNLLRYMAVVMGILEFGGWGSMFYDLA